MRALCGTEVSSLGFSPGAAMSLVIGVSLGRQLGGRGQRHGEATATTYACVAYRTTPADRSWPDRCGPGAFEHCHLTLIRTRVISGPLTSCAVRPVSHCRLGRGPDTIANGGTPNMRTVSAISSRLPLTFYMKAPSGDQVVPPGLPGSRLMPADDVAAVPPITSGRPAPALTVLGAEAADVLTQAATAMQAPQTLLGPLTDRPRRNQSAASDPASDRTAAGHHAGLLVKLLDPFSTRHGLAGWVGGRADRHPRADRGGAIAGHTHTSSPRTASPAGCLTSVLSHHRLRNFPSC